MSTEKEKIKNLMLNRYKGSNEIVKHIPKILLKKMTTKRGVMCIIASALLSILIMCNSNNTYSLIKVLNIVLDKSFDFAVGIFSSVLTGYVLFQTLTQSERAIKLYLLVEHESDSKESKLEKLNKNFIIFISGIVILICINLLFSLLVNILDIFDMSMSVKVIMFIILMAYFYYLVNIIVELLCFINNVYQIIIIDISSNAVNILNKDKEDGVKK